MKRHSEFSSGSALILTALIALVAGNGCGKDDSFGVSGVSKTAQPLILSPSSSQSVSPATTQKIEGKAKVDILWVIDNSSSMDPSQAKLRTALKDFAQQYLKPQYDIRTAVITTDTYLASPDFTGYVTSGSKSPLNQIHPWSGSYARLTATGPDGKLLHDGPIPARCDKQSASHLASFYFGYPQCWKRDGSSERDYDSARARCLSASSETDFTACVNTYNNNSLHSGRPIISTLPAAGETADAAWNQRLIEDFLVDVSVSTSGSGYERGLGSLLQFLQDNEDPASNPDDSTRLFRPGSQRVIVFLSDEDDQTLDDAALMRKLHKSAGNYQPSLGFANPNKTPSAFGPYTLTMQVNQPLVPVEQVKAAIDAAFQKIDQGNGSAPGSYFVAAIVTASGESAKTLHDLQTQAHGNQALTDETGNHKDWENSTDQEVGQRYLDLVKLVDHGSTSLDILSADYKPILSKIGLTMVTESIRRTSQFRLSTDPEDPRLVTVRINHGNGQTSPVSASQFKIEGSTLTITDKALLESLQPSDKVEITFNRDPKRINTYHLDRRIAGPGQVQVTILHGDGSKTLLRPDQFTAANGPDGMGVLTITDNPVISAFVATDQIRIDFQPGAAPR